MEDTTRLENTVFEYPKLKDFMLENQTSPQEVRDILREIAANYDVPTMNKLKKTFDLSFGRVYKDVILHHEEDIDIRSLARDCNLVLVPNHQSYADFMGMIYAFFRDYQLPVHIAAGINLNIFGVGKIFRRAGAFFIRRSFRDQVLYKYTLEGYLYYLLMHSRPLKFYFEGGRSRTGKLKPPKYGLFNMILEAYSYIPADIRKPLCFLPVSISHEYLPDYKGHQYELTGRKKKNESAFQLWKVSKVFFQNFGNIHLHIGRAIFVDELKADRQKQVQSIAFNCFRRVGKNIIVTPTSLVSLILLDQVIGSQTFESILEKAKKVTQYCQTYNIPLSANLKTSLEEVLQLTLNEMLENGKVIKEKHIALDEDIYFVPEKSRAELLYLKNTILHHFLLPLFISSAWINIFRGTIQNVAELREFFLQQRNLLKFEFYLPETDEMFVMLRKIISKTLDIEQFDFENSFKLSQKEFFHLGESLNTFASSFSYIFESYYITALTLKTSKSKSFLLEDIVKKAFAIFETELKYGRLIRSPESYSKPLIKSSMDYFVSIGVLKQTGDSFKIADQRRLGLVVEAFVQLLSDFLSLNIKTQSKSNSNYEILMAKPKSELSGAN